MRRAVVKGLRHLNAVSIENGVGPGTPDVNYADGWIELKSLERWPPKGGPLRIPHFTGQQKVWLLRRRRAGGQAFVLVKVGNDWLLFDGWVAARNLGELPREELIPLTIRTWEGRMDYEEMTECLRKPLPPASVYGSSGVEGASL